MQISLDVYIKHKIVLKMTIRSCKRNYCKKIVSKYQKNTHEIWKLINTCLGRNMHSIPKFETMSADDLNNFFNNLGSEANKDIVPVGSFMEFLLKPIINSMFLTPSTSNEIY